MNETILSQMMQAYAIEAFQGRSVNTDEQGIIFARDLISMSKEIYREEMPAPVALTMFEKEPGISDGAKWAGYRLYSAQGMAKIMAAFGTDMPMVNAKGKEFFALMYPVGLGYGYTYDDMLAAAETGTKLDVMQGINAREIHERTISNIIWTGDSEYQIIGFINHPNIPEVAVDGGWGSAAVLDILADIVALISAVNSSKVYNANKFQFPSNAWSIVQGAPMPSTSDTLLSYLRKAYPEITFSKNSDLDDEGICMVMDMNRRNFSQATPFIFRQLPVQRSGLDISIPCVSKTAGVIVRAPLAAAKSTKVV